VLSVLDIARLRSIAIALLFEWSKVINSNSLQISDLISEQVIQKWMYSHIFTLLKEEANTYKTAICAA
jgi:hypothetical protein